MSVRAFYKVFSGIISSIHNNSLLISGLISSFSLPMVGVFDNKDSRMFHALFAGLFFSSSIYYLTSLAVLMKTRYPILKHKYISLNEKTVTFTYHFTFMCLIPVIGFFLGVLTMGGHFWMTALFEWFCVFSYMTLTMILVSQNPYNDSLIIHSDDSQLDIKY